MTALRQFAAILPVLLISACSHVDSCTRLRHFREYSWPSRAYYELPAVDVATLPPAVREAVAVRMREQVVGDPDFEIFAARENDSYLLLSVRQACFDCDRWFVYAKDRRCVVGTFVLGLQG